MTGAGSASRFLVVGLGSIGRRHLANLRRLRPDSRIAALRRSVDGTPLPPECEAQFSSLDDARSFRPDAVILAGPAPTHVPLARTFVELGAPVLIEKPLSHDLEGLADLMAAARQGGTPVMVGYNLRFDPSLQAVRAALLAGEVGAPRLVRAEVGQYLPSWRPGADYRTTVSAQSALGGGALLELSHEIDYVYWMLGLPDRVSCRGGRLSDLEIDVEDFCEISLHYDAQPCVVSIHLDFLQRIPVRQCRIVGAGGTLLWDALDGTVTVRTPGPPAADRIVRPGSGDRNQMYLDEMAAFLDVVDHGRSVPVPLEDGVAVMRIIETARRAMASGATEVLCPAPESGK
jgi:predicted dehydrogenase